MFPLPAPSGLAGKTETSSFSRRYYYSRRAVGIFSAAIFTLSPVGPGLPQLNITAIPEPKGGKR